MHYGAHIFLFTDHWSDEAFWIFDEAQALGLGCLDISIGDDVYFDVKRCRHLAESRQLELMISPGSEWPLHADISADDPAQRQLGVDWHKQQIDLANELGAIAYTGAIYGHTGVVKKRRPPVDEYKWTAEALHQLAEHAQSRGVIIALEAMSHFRTHLANKPEQLVELIRLADHPQLRIAFDTYHAITEVRDYGASIRNCGDLLWGLQACENDRGVPGGGLVPWSSVFSALQDIAFDGYVVLETYNSSIGDFAYQRAMFHDPCPDYKSFIKTGIDFLKTGLASNYQ